jgi:hypothetical protein
MLRRLAALLIIAFIAAPAFADDTNTTAPSPPPVGGATPVPASKSAEKDAEPAAKQAPAPAKPAAATPGLLDGMAPAQTKAWNNPKKPKPIFATVPPNPNPKCKAGTSVLVEVRGVPVLLPREAGYRLTMDDGKTHLTLGRPGKDYTCDTPLIKNVRGFVTSDYHLGLPGGNSGSETAFAKERAVMLQAAKLRGSIVQTLPNGIQKIVAPMIGSELFQLPLDKAPTFDKAPVVFACDTSESADLAKIVPQYCRVAYLHPSGLPITYNVQRTDVEKDDFITADAKVRKQVDALIDGAKAKTDLENKDK